MPRKSTPLKKSSRNSYLIPILSKAFDIMELLQSERTPMSLETIHKRTGFPKATAYRVLQTAVHRGYLSRSENGHYRYISKPSKLRFGFASQSSDMPFSEAVTESLRSAAVNSGIDLMILDNRYDGATAIKNADEFIKARVDLIIEFQVDPDAAPVLGDRISVAGIPLIAIDNPHTHATYFGIDNYRAGHDAGEYLARYAIRRWKRNVDRVVGLDMKGGPLVESRITGSLDSIRTLLPEISPDKFHRLDGMGRREKSKRAVAEFLAKYPKDTHILIAAVNDTSALGALEAARETKREHHLAICGQDCIREALDEMKRHGSPIVASVSHSVQDYGPSIIAVALAILGGKSVPPYNYVNHRVITQSMARQNTESISNHF